MRLNNLCADKYIRLGREWQFKDQELMGRETMEELAEVARRSGVVPEIVHWSGSTKIETETVTEEEKPRLQLVKQ